MVQISLTTSVHWGNLEEISDWRFSWMLQQVIEDKSAGRQITVFELQIAMYTLSSSWTVGHMWVIEGAHVAHWPWLALPWPIAITQGLLSGVLQICFIFNLLD